jgi:hypothetical protein
MMTRRSKIWLALAVLFSVVNFAGGVYAAVQGELLHAGVHAVLFLLGAYPVLRLTSGSDEHRSRRRVESAIAAPPRELTDRLTRIEQAVDAVAIEVERVGEWQRFLTRPFTENGTPRAPGEDVAEPIAVEPQEELPHDRTR